MKKRDARAEYCFLNVLIADVVVVSSLVPRPTPFLLVKENRKKNLHAKTLESSR